MTGVPPQAGSGHSPKGEAAISVASSAKPSVPNAAKAKQQFPEVRHAYFKRGVQGQVFAVMCEGGGLPTVLHDSFNDAAYQAAFLAHRNPGFRFHVLASHRASFVDAASAIEARSDATGTGAAEGESAASEAGDAR